VGSCGHGNEPLGSVKDRLILDEGCAHWSYNLLRIRTCNFDNVHVGCP
jgi:hypothetical protein